MSYEKSTAECDECQDTIMDDETIVCGDCYAALETKLEGTKIELEGAEELITDLELELTEADAELGRLNDEIAEMEKD